MNDVLPWLEYKWSFDFPVGLYRAICARLRGTPAQLEETLRPLDAATLRRKPGAKWSLQEHAGHLGKIEELWQTRFEEFLRGEKTLTAADMSNRRTSEAGFNDLPLEPVLRGFRAARAATLARLDSLTLADAARVAHHPRLNVPIRLVDLCYFAAEHDAHHLAVIQAMIRG
jgi:uncharacterized damage-inducible protein DinB